MNKLIDVYVKTDNNNNVIDINSSVFINDVLGWVWIDNGYGDKYSHAQNHYFSKPLFNSKGEANYQYINGKVVERGI